MLGRGLNIFFRLSTTTRQRVLHPARVVESREGLWRATLEEDDAPIAAATDVLIYYERDRRFTQQPARVESLERGVSGERIVEFRTTGSPATAESRQAYRVSTVIDGLTARVGKEDACPLLDVSATGFSVVATASYTIGRVVDATLRHAGTEFTGMACVLSAAPVGPRGMRYGLRYIDDKRPGSGLQAGLQKISSAAQRLQLRRLSGAA